MNSDLHELYDLDMYLESGVNDEPSEKYEKALEKNPGLREAENYLRLSAKEEK